VLIPGDLGTQNRECKSFVSRTSEGVLEVRILKELRTRSLEVRILKNLPLHRALLAS